jgi:integrase/recombinase XerD
MAPRLKLFSPLCRRMIDDIRMRKLSLKTRNHTIRAVRQFAGYLRRSPDKATAENLRRHKLPLVDPGYLASLAQCSDDGAKIFLCDHGRSSLADCQDAAGACSAHPAGYTQPR